MFWWNKAKQNQTPPATSPTAAHVNPQVELEAFGPVARHNHIAYVPSKAWSGVPGVGTGNLAYVPDYLLSPPMSYAGNGMLRAPNSVMIAQQPVMITRPKAVIEGIGGVVAGQMVHQPLLEVDVDNDASLGE